MTPACTQAPGGTLHWVLDTNVVLDWLVFADAHMEAAAAWLHEGRARWLHTPAMLEELFDVVSREQVLRRAGADAAALGRRVRQAAQDHGLLLPEAPACAWRCADPDDQMFIDLAAHARAQCLLTRDKALLALAPRCSAPGLRILRPAELGPLQA
ncbi:putative toxin-antitoxin system toxin component, PIN family [Thiomonas sp. FB-6]|uniref:PIN domain-containing protein n=1 Tax=Thiomonas sp. FB-6 TaxID=1158291 RepID=UPI0003757F13|nr:PIN domain-containing protein [Thiomonas sp. FB-6]